MVWKRKMGSNTGQEIEKSDWNGKGNWKGKFEWKNEKENQTGKLERKIGKGNRKENKQGWRGKEDK